MMTEPSLITDEASLARAIEHLEGMPRVAVDLESNGMFAYRAVACIVQIAAGNDVFLVDALATSIAPLARLLASGATEKIVHDVSFDARILAENGVHLANVRDTSVAARMLGRTATGLASLLASELGLAIDKKMQHHDWSERPLDRAAVAYLAGDVVHLSALADRLFGEVRERGIEDEVEEETRYRLAQAIEASGAEDPRPPYVRLKGVDRAPSRDLPILRHLAEVRERHARDLGVPPYKVLAPDVLFAIAAAKPQDEAALSRIRGAMGGRRARALAGEVLDAVVCGLEDETIPDEDRRWFEKPRIPGALLRARRAREQRLSRWRREESKIRGVDEQVILPGHCLQDLADLTEPSLDAIAAVAGIGAFRVARYGAGLLRALAAEDSATHDEESPA
ncbi:MAG: ribonuclease D [Deltaproteobacteria bacterium]|nr:ribonuclease D [Deltaproteobacteria bacterium]